MPAVKRRNASYEWLLTACPWPEHNKDTWGNNTERIIMFSDTNVYSPDTFMVRSGKAPSIWDYIYSIIHSLDQHKYASQLGIGLAI